MRGSTSIGDTMAALQRPLKPKPTIDTMFNRLVWNLTGPVKVLICNLLWAGICDFRADFP